MPVGAVLYFLAAGEQPVPDDVHPAQDFDQKVKEIAARKLPRRLLLGGRGFGGLENLLVVGVTLKPAFAQ